jgi:hypothetical protein
MLEHWLIELIGHFSGLSDAQLKQIEKSLPATKALVDLLNRAKPIIEQAEKLYTEAEPLIDEAKKEWETVGPAAQILLDVISHHVNRGNSPAEAAARLGGWPMSTSSSTSAILFKPGRRLETLGGFGPLRPTSGLIQKSRHQSFRQSGRCQNTASLAGAMH